ncbi:hypothetical protein ACXFAU_05020 [Paenibacillus glucanolyticus]
MVKKCVNLIHGLSSKTNGELTCYYRSQQIIILVGKNENKPPVTVNETKAFAHELVELLTREMKKRSFLSASAASIKHSLPCIEASSKPRKPCD